MNDLRRWLKLFVGMAFIFLQSCGSIPVQPLESPPLKFHQAISTLAHHLLTQVKKHDESYTALDSPITIVIDPFVDANGGEVIKASRAIEQIIKDEGEKNFSLFNLVRLTPQTLNAARYLIDGVLLYEALTNHSDPNERKYYHVFASVIEIKTGQVVASSNVWIADTTLDNGTVIGSPMVNIDAYLQNLVVTAKLPPGMQVDLKYLNSLSTNALLAEAETTYEKQEYEKSRFLFSKATERPEGQVMRTYAGLYRTNLNLRDDKGTEEAFGKLVIVGIRDNNLSARFLFAVNSTQFIEDAELRKQYAMWLYQIGKYFDKSNSCLHIIGHASRTGDGKYNQQLSHQRAQAIQKVIQKDFPDIVHRSKAFGEGFRYCKVCSGTDDSKDSVDRRVEFKVVDCAQLDRRDVSLKSDAVKAK